MNRAGTSLGQYLEQARREAGLTIRQLANVSGVQKTAIGRLELGQVRSPRPEHLTRLAEALEVPMSDLFVLAGNPIPQAPNVEALLRAEYDLLETALAETRQHIDAIVRRYATPNRKEQSHGNNKHTG